MRILLATLSAILCLTSPVLGANWQVAADGSGDAPTISAALDTYAAAGDSIELTGGIYSGTGNVSLEILLADITLWSTAAEAVIDCGGTVNGITVWADGFRAEGFRITDGQAIDGGGVLINDGSSQFIDIMIDACNATRGAGFYQASAGTLLLDNCVIRDCSTSLGGGI